jgi:16S rRNA (guanine527-N7)-methyltransferase
MEIGSPEWSRLIIAGAALGGLDLGADQVDLFARHAQELLRWNAVTNLTAITDAEAIARDHFLDSLAPAGLIARGSDLLDVGTGGGFPGLPLHIVIPDLRTTLLEAVRKKASFLRHVVRKLGLKRIQVVHARVEDLARQPEHARRYDVILSRAVGALPMLVRAILPMLKARGRLIALRGGGSRAEIEDLRSAADGGPEFAGARLSFDLKQYTLTGLKNQRILVVVSRSEPAL